MMGRDRDTEISGTQQEPSIIMIDSAIAKIKRLTADVAPTVVDNEKEPGGQPREPRFGT